MPEHTNRASALIPLQDAVVGDVAEQQVPPGREVHRTFCPPPTREDALDAVVTGDNAEPVIKNLELGLDRVLRLVRHELHQWPPSPRRHIVTNTQIKKTVPSTVGGCTGSSGRADVRACDDPTGTTNARLHRLTHGESD